MTDTTMTKRRMTDSTMAKRRMTDNTMTKRRMTDNTMTKRRRTDNTMAKNNLENIIESPFTFSLDFTRILVAEKTDIWHMSYITFCYTTVVILVLLWTQKHILMRRITIYVRSYVNILRIA
jgi:hypothetical protein